MVFFITGGFMDFIQLTPQRLFALLCGRPELLHAVHLLRRDRQALGPAPSAHVPSASLGGHQGLRTLEFL
jgi:hypothetical protein